MNRKWQLSSGILFSLVLAMAACERNRLLEGGDPAPAGQASEGQVSEDEVKMGTVNLKLTYNVTPNPEWQPERKVFLYADARRNPNINQEDIFQSVQFPGVYCRDPNQVFNFDVGNVKAGEKIIVQGYMCAEGTTDCTPSDKDNPPACSAEVHIRGNFEPSCQPTFTWTGGDAEGNVVCQATCN